MATFHDSNTSLLPVTNGTALWTLRLTMAYLWQTWPDIHPGIAQTDLWLSPACYLPAKCPVNHTVTL